MFSSMLESVRNNPFKAQCEESGSENTQLVPTRTIQAADANEGEVEFGSTKFFALCGVGGILSCGTTHTFVVPLDLVKCRLQVDQAKYKNLFHGFKVTIAEEGARGLAKGWAPTLFGYSAQVSTNLMIHHSRDFLLNDSCTFYLTFLLSPFRVFSSSVYMKFSRSSTQKCWEKRTLTCTVPVCS